ncbi:MAG: tetratricopeptide repeat protein [Planctomycetota bacterium]|nr:tetratricopeptide repeat protein [Planctomycetota bacterium]
MAALAEARILTQRLSLNPAKLDLGLKLANLYANNLFPDRAMAVLGLCLELEEQVPVTLKLCAASFAGLGRFEESAALLEHVARLDPTDHGLAGPMFRAYWELGELGAARAALDKGLELQPFSPHLRLRLGQLLVEEGQLEAALPELEAAAQNLPNSTEAWFRYGRCLEELGREDEAVEVARHHGLLVQMEEFGIPDHLTWRVRVERLAGRLDETGDGAGATALRAAEL